MDRKQEIEIRCYEKAQELLDKYFPSFIEDAVVIKPELLAEEYDKGLPKRVMAEFSDWLSCLWEEEIRPEVQESFDEIMNSDQSIKMTDSSYVPYLEDAQKKAETVTLWEKLTKTNHKDVNLYKGILKQYTEELLRVIIEDLLADIPE